MKKFFSLAKTELTTAQTAASMIAIALAVLSLGAASVEQLSVDYTTRACAQNVNFTGTFQVAGVAPASANTASAIVKRDGSGNFTAGTITATLTGTASGNIASTSLSLDSALGSSTTLVPCQNAVKTYADTKASISTGTLIAMPLTNTKKIGDIYITDSADAYICCATGADTTGWKKAN